MKLSVVVLTKNEESLIRRCLDSVTFCDEIVVIDDYSTDKTVSIAKQSGCRVFRRHLNDFASQRNFGLTKTKGEWVLFIDADEVVTPDLGDEILLVTKSDDFVGYYIKRRDTLWRRQMRYGEVGRSVLLRLAKRNSGEWKRKVHEIWEVRGEIRVLKNTLMHMPESSVRNYITKINKYSSLHVASNFDERKTSTLTKIIFFPAAKFLHNYILKLGLLDGVQGFVLACIMSFHSFLAWSKLWLIQVSKN